jgi:hypothetical protein
MTESSEGKLDVSPEVQELLEKHQQSRVRRFEAEATVREIRAETKRLEAELLRAGFRTFRPDYW